MVFSAMTMFQGKLQLFQVLRYFSLSHFIFFTGANPFFTLGNCATLKQTCSSSSLRLLRDIGFCFQFRPYILQACNNIFCRVIPASASLATAIVHHPALGHAECCATISFIIFLLELRLERQRHGNQVVTCSLLVDAIMARQLSERSHEIANGRLMVQLHNIHENAKRFLRRCINRSSKGPIALDILQFTVCC
jgi:hypothetical protein